MMPTALAVPLSENTEGIPAITLIALATKLGAIVVCKSFTWLPVRSIRTHSDTLDTLFNLTLVT